MRIYLRLLVISLLYLLQFAGVTTDYTQYECPAGWDEFSDHCYRFIIDDPSNRATATSRCKEDSGILLSVNSDFEHSFIVGELERYDTGSERRDWWTSGRREGDTMEFFWEGDGRKIESYFYWHDPSIPEDLDLDHIIYNYNGFDWGWILGDGSEELSYICKVSKEDIFMISYHERGPDYGLDNPDPETVPRGPRFLVIPEDTIYEEFHYDPIDIWYNPFDDRSQTELVELHCDADAYPPAEYSWFREASGQVEKIDLETNNRYTLINGRLVIHSPSTQTNDQGNYRCLAKNEFGSIMSPWAKLDFGYLGDFSTAQRAPIEAPEFQFATIPCHAPSAFPAVVYAWYKTDLRNFVRPDLKPHMFISWDGSLYFSSVTLDDENDYFCLVNKPGRVLTSGKRSQPISLNVRTGNPGDHDPQIGDSFPKIFPTDAKVGDNLRLECWAYGTTESRALQYTWQKISIDDDGEEYEIPLPKQSRLDDHNRILNIPNAQSYDQGTYKCTVTKPTGVSGASVSRTIPINLDAEPYFVSPLTDKFIDINTNLAWVCEAIGTPGVKYNWYKNGIHYTQFSIPPGQRDRISITNNRLEINNVQEFDNGMYQCEAHNSHGSNFSSAELRVLSFAPTFTNLAVQEDMQATDGGNMTIFCIPEAAPAPEITWRKDGSLLNPGDQETDRIRQMPNGNLLISPVQFSDSGLYRCDAVNELGSANSSGVLTVLEEITMAQTPMAQVVELNKTTFMGCQASHNPQMDVTYVWYQGDMMIIFIKVFRLGENRYEVWHDPHFKAGTGIFIGGLYIMDAQFWHKGRYTCRVEASGTVIERYADLDVIGPPSEPAGVMIEDGSINATAATVKWKASHDNGANILSFVIEALNVREGFWKIIRTNVMPQEDQFGTYMYTINDLRPYSRYRIRLRAENRLGTSVPSIPSEDFGTDAVKPDLYPDMIGGGGGKVGDLTITWEPLPPWEENGPGIGYRVYWKLKGDDDFADQRVVEIMGSVGQLVILVGQDDFYLEYDILVQAFNDIGDGPLPPLVNVRSAMGMPDAVATNVKARPYNSTACVVTWDPVLDTRATVKGKLGGYKMGFWEASVGLLFGMPERVTLNGQVTEGMVIGLKPDMRYFFNVYVWTDAGTGPKSTHFEQITLRQAPVNQPTEVRVKKLDDETVWVWWRGVSTDQTEEPLEGYMVRIWREGEHIKNATDYDARKDTVLTVRGLLPEEPYKLRVFGYSRGGWGTMSSPAVRFTLADGASALHLSMTTMLVCFILIIINYNK